MKVLNNIVTKIKNAHKMSLVHRAAKKYNVEIPDYVTIDVTNPTEHFNANGYCKEDHDKPMHSIIALNMDSLKGHPYALAAVLQHELIHAEQVHRGDLFITDMGSVWKKRLTPIEKVSTKGMSTLEKIDALTEAPWELEAYGRTLVEYGFKYNSEEKNNFLAAKYMASIA